MAGPLSRLRTGEGKGDGGVGWVGSLRCGLARIMQWGECDRGGDVTMITCLLGAWWHLLSSLHLGKGVTVVDCLNWGHVASHFSPFHPYNRLGRDVAVLI